MWKWECKTMSMSVCVCVSTCVCERNFICFLCECVSVSVSVWGVWVCKCGLIVSPWMCEFVSAWEGACMIEYVSVSVSLCVGGEGGAEYVNVGMTVKVWVCECVRRACMIQCVSVNVSGWVWMRFCVWVCKSGYDHLTMRVWVCECVSMRIDECKCECVCVWVNACVCGWVWILWVQKRIEKFCWWRVFVTLPHSGNDLLSFGSGKMVVLSKL